MALARVGDCERSLEDVQKIISKLERSSRSTVDQFEKLMDDDNGYGDDAVDLASYFKSPMMFIAAGKFDLARKLLKFIKRQFMTTDGDFKTNHNMKSKKPEYSEYYTYINGWIMRAAMLLNDSEVIKNGFQFLKTYHLYNSFFLTNEQNNISDILTVAHQGLLNLEAGNNDTAILAGERLIDILHKQININDGFHLRFDQQTKLVTNFPGEMSAFYYVSAKELNQLYFMIGYPCAFLAILFKEIGESKFLKASEKHFDFAMQCDGNLFECDFSHKIAWAASILLEITGDKKYLTPIEKITNYFINKQGQNGLWFTKDGANISLDQSAEIACWFININNNLSLFSKRFPHEAVGEDSSSYSSIIPPKM